MTVSVRCGAVTDVGRLRARNEDAVLAIPPVFAVADGMGGHHGGDVASALAIAGLEQFQGAAAVDARSVITAIREANRAIFDQASVGEGAMGTTVVGVALSRDEASDALLLFNVGDSRAYRLRGDDLVQLSKDHSLVAELVTAGELTAAEAKVDQRRNVVTRALGVDGSIDIDEWLMEPEVGDRYLMCSDGLTGEVSDGDIAAVLRAGTSPEEAAGALVQMALDAGGHDNVSVVVVDIEAVGEVDNGIDADTDPRRPVVAERPEVDDTK
jgi:serine/threonine protein phosphatase PrpC